MVDVVTQQSQDALAQPIVEPREGQTVSLRITHAQGQAQVHFETQYWPALYLLAQRSAPSDDALHQALLDLLLEPVAQKLDALGLHGLQFDHLTPCEASSAPITPDSDRSSRVVLHCQWTDQLATQPAQPALPFAITLHTIDAGLLDYCEQRLSEQALALPPFVRAIHLAGRAVIGAQYLKLSTLCRLRSGDVLVGGVSPEYRPLLDASPSLPHLELTWGLSGAQVLRGVAALEGQNLVIKEKIVVHKNDQEDLSSVEHSEQAMQEDEELSHLAALDVPVRFEIDTVAVPLAQLCALSPGHIMELPISLAHAPVRLITNGKTIGSGELIAIGEHLGVRIQKMAKIDDSV